LIRTPLTNTVSIKIKGCLKAAIAYRLPKDSIHVVECGDEVNCAYEKAIQLLQNEKSITAFYTWDDIMAIGVAKAVIDSGFRIPDDIALVGYNDIEIAKYFSPPLTTIRQKTKEIGETIAEILISKLEDEIQNVPQHVVLDPELVIRQTT
jgi:LacI family transcriptional regulator